MRRINLCVRESNVIDEVAESYVDDLMMQFKAGMVVGYTVIGNQQREL